MPTAVSSISQKPFGLAFLICAQLTIHDCSATILEEKRKALQFTLSTYSLQSTEYSLIYTIKLLYVIYVLYVIIYISFILLHFLVITFLLSTRHQRLPL